MKSKSSCLCRAPSSRPCPLFSAISFASCTVTSNWTRVTAQGRLLGRRIARQLALLTWNYSVFVQWLRRRSQRQLLVMMKMNLDPRHTSSPNQMMTCVEHHRALASFICTIKHLRHLWQPQPFPRHPCHVAHPRFHQVLSARLQCPKLSATLTRVTSLLVVRSLVMMQTSHQKSCIAQI